MLNLIDNRFKAALRSVPVWHRVGRLESVQGTITASLQGAVGELCEVRSNAGRTWLAEIIGFANHCVKIMPYGFNDQLQQGDEVIALGHALRVPVGTGVLGRVMNALGTPIDNLGPLRGHRWVEMDNQPPDTLTRHDISQVFTTGQKSIDGLLTMGRGQRIGLFGGSGVGKSTLLGQIASHASADVNVVVLVGERSREVAPFVKYVLGPTGMAKSAVVVATSNESPLARVRAADAALTMADWFRRQGSNVLLILDSITRFAMAQRDLGLMLGEPPTSRGYTPSVFHKMSVLLERMGAAERGSITGIVTVLVEGDDMNDPIADSVRAILDGHVVLSRKLANAGHFPAIDILHSNSRLFLELADGEHQCTALAIRQILARFDDVSDLLQIGAYQKGVSAATDLAIELQPQVNQFLQQGLNDPQPWATTLRALSSIAQRWITMTA